MHSTNGFRPHLLRLAHSRSGSMCIIIILAIHRLVFRVLWLDRIAKTEAKVKPLVCVSDSYTDVASFCGRPYYMWIKKVDNRCQDIQSKSKSFISWLPQSVDSKPNRYYKAYAEKKL